ncbi:mitochondrial succinate dehydrogenase subunit C [Eremomyces bilateralis CBS 781.70]|uniref:Mitochondrial succinate dehydrogenase subunit C n=1 Tax=Eremomyces bilateralis CBS 781.70 TaxID=1392243 RepID=A0A6G1G282_9PEZI|nr:mitochondrial succinate dehydrogenase subunit C [Eremomyces bilateralis CBS 781.70]KAF1812153.1 mitochondrial succinate dehydrogenase subunit C [Eremomyces bilateralis CBS 781.70]
MLATRAVQSSLRRLAVQPSSRTVLSKWASPAAIATNAHLVQRRQVQTVSGDPNANSELIKQRLARPVSPHISIYRFSHWYASGFHRITGILLSGGFYLYMAAYAAAPSLGWQIGSASLAAGFGAWPIAAKIATKFAVASPFVYHCVNGLRHLTWDTGKMFSLTMVKRTEVLTVVTALVGALTLAFI